SPCVTHRPRARPQGPRGVDLALRRSPHRRARRAPRDRRRHAARAAGPPPRPASARRRPAVAGLASALIRRTLALIRRTLALIRRTLALVLERTRDDLAGCREQDLPPGIQL